MWAQAESSDQGITAQSGVPAIYSDDVACKALQPEY